MIGWIVLGLVVVVFVSVMCGLGLLVADMLSESDAERDARLSRVDLELDELYPRRIGGWRL